MKYGLVLAGGGARGAYQAGVVRALEEMNIELSAVCGTSIGAMNGAAVLMGGYEFMNRLWREIRLTDIMDIDEKAAENFLSISNMSELVKTMAGGGYDITPLEKYLKKNIDEKKIRDSKLDFGLASVSLTNKKLVKLFKDDIPEGELYKYLIASASLPFFKTKTLSGERFTDGGLLDNMPVDMLTEKGIKDIICVDVRGIGFKKDICDAGLNIININCEKPFVGIMDFGGEGIEQSIENGYYDCKRVFGVYSGKRFYIPSEEYIAAKSRYSIDLIEGAEHAAEIFGVERFCEYKFDELVSKMLDGYRMYAREEAAPDGEKAVVIRLIRMLGSDKLEFINRKLDVFGKFYDAAGAIMYFERKF